MKRRRIRFAAVVFGLALVGSAGQLMAADYQHEVQDKDISFSWSVAGEDLAVKIVAKTDGWVGIGFNPSNKMKDANYVLGYVKDGKAEISDEFGTRDNAHDTDEKLGGTSDVVLVGGSEEGGITTIEFTMPLDSGDAYDRPIQIDGDTVVHLAYGAGRDSFRSKHKYRTSMVINLATGAVK
jgi:hypothetical protein